jgi:hypothetical protein
MWRDAMPIISIVARRCNTNLQRPPQLLIKPKQMCIKGTVQRKLTGVLSGINRKHMNCHCSDGCPFFNLKGLRSLKSENVFSAA